MHRWLLLFVALAASVGLAGCYRHSFPGTKSFPVVDDQPHVARVFVDANGTFYPTGWRTHLQPQLIWNDDSLLNESHNEPVFRRLILDDERRQLGELGTFISRHDRIFILVHGYNNSQRVASEAYARIRNLIALTDRDGVIEFYWDGLVATPDIMLNPMPLRFWFFATGYSQVAGSRGLRRILQLAERKDIYLVSHSRGASVILSALADPPYDPDFRDQTLSLAFTSNAEITGGGPFLHPPALVPRGNNIRLIFMAPAIGRPDFRDASCEQARPVDPVPCDHPRRFTRELRSIRYTVNGADPVLGKLIGIPQLLNSTELGYRADVGRMLARTYPMTEYCLRMPHAHPFERYIEDPELIEMLNDSGVATERPLPGDIGPRPTCPVANANGR